MDWNAAIDKHREALKRVLETLVAMVRSGPIGTKSQRFGFSSERTPEVLAEGWADLTADALTLPRHLHRAVLRLLRPAEAAARRLVIVAARDVVHPSSPHGERVSSRFAEGKSVVPVARWKAGERRDAAKQRGPGRSGNGGVAPSYPARIAFPLFDPPRCLPHKRLRASATAMPRISIPGYTVPAPLPKPPAPDDPIDARRLTLRLAALARALDDLPREARRFARWRGRDAAGTQNHKISDAGRMRRVWPLRSGRPPGQRPANSRRPAHEVHRILDDIHGLAFWVLEAPDTS